ncbi:YcjF family protein [Thalassotalea marina]|uniref:TIGR01620 family protein n=1 Tax=Thalassotalea marina TaxID=1673741 RepID=A0A919EMA3_9GAMM|nr:TIGR01620 family protein [Thalassotalea marina]GHF98332.1 hypothetical protein GCM10017161_28510 [Thalassotalea marina]
MSSTEKDFKQQVLFEEPADEVKLSVASEPKSQIVIADEQFTEVDEREDDLVEISDVIESKGKKNWLRRLIFSLIGLLIVIEAVFFFQEGFNDTPIIASIYALLFALIATVFGHTVYKEIKSLRSLKKRKHQQEKIISALHSASDIDARKMCDEIAAQLPSDMQQVIENKWSTTIPAELSQKEVISVFSSTVLAETDAKSIDKITKFSAEATVLVALSPIAIVDMMILFWRNLKMIDEISQLYGLQLSYWARIKLIKQVFINMAYAGASELIVDVGADLIGADLLGKLSSRLAQGLGAGMLTARLGIQTMKMCRPIPFSSQNSPKIKDVRKQLIAKIKNISERS